MRRRDAPGRRRRRGAGEDRHQLLELHRGSRPQLRLLRVHVRAARPARRHGNRLALEPRHQRARLHRRGRQGPRAHPPRRHRRSAQNPKPARHRQLREGQGRGARALRGGFGFRAPRQDGRGHRTHRRHLAQRRRLLLRRSARESRARRASRGADLREAKVRLRRGRRGGLHPQDAPAPAPDACEVPANASVVRMAVRIRREGREVPAAPLRQRLDRRVQGRVLVLEDDQRDDVALLLHPRSRAGPGRGAPGRDEGRDRSHRGFARGGRR